MRVIEILQGITLLLLCLKISYEDIKHGIISNRLLALFLVIEVGLDIVYYGFFVGDILRDFVINVLIVILIALLLFYTNSFAGGDSKYAIVLAVGYPARLYLLYGSMNYTLFFYIGVAIVFGFGYLIINSILKIFSGKNTITFPGVRNAVVTFVKGYCIALIYVCVVTYSFLLLQNKGLIISQWILIVVSVAMVMSVARLSFLSSKKVLLVVLAMDVIFSFYFKQIPFSLDISKYYLVLALLLIQIVVKTNLYDEINISDLKKGMILSSMSSLLMQNSRIRGLPGVSSEDLKSRLSEENISSIKRWAASHDIRTIVIVKKIPFAIFLSLGLFAYFIVGSL